MPGEPLPGARIVPVRSEHRRNTATADDDVCHVVALFGGSIAGLGLLRARHECADFGPRLFAFFEGWGSNAFPGPYGYWWVPILGPLVGGAVAPFIYDFFIGATLAARNPGASPGRTDAL